MSSVTTTPDAPTTRTTRRGRGRHVADRPSLMDRVLRLLLGLPQ